MVTGTIKNTVRLQMLNNEWQQKKKDIEKDRKRSEMTEAERTLADFNERAEAVRESNKHADTYNKLKSGGKLTAAEIDYLEKNDPEALRRYREDQAEKAAYEKALKNCRSKEEVERLKTFKLGELASEAKDITNNPYIPKDKKLELMNQLNNKLCLQQEAYFKYVESKQYQQLPTEAEEALERAEDNEAVDAENRFETKPDIMSETVLETMPETVPESAGEENDGALIDTDENQAHTEIDNKEISATAGNNKNTDFDRVENKIKRAVLELNAQKAKLDIKL